MNWIPQGWTTQKASGWWEFHHLIHEPCGYRSHNAYDLVLDLNFGGRREAREVISSHECPEEY